MRLIPTRQATKLTGLSAAKLREWTSRRALIPADVPPRAQGSPAQYGWQTILLLRVAVVLRDRFHLELQAHREIFGSFRTNLMETSFVALWGKVLALHDEHSWSLFDTDDQLGDAQDALLIRLDPHLEVLAVGFALPNPSRILGQLDLFPTQPVPSRRGRETGSPDDGMPMAMQIEPQRRSA